MYSKRGSERGICRIRTKEVYLAKYRETKRVLSRVRRDPLDTWFEKLNSTEGKKKMYAMVNQLKRDKKDIVGGYFIKSNAGEIVTEERGIREVWREYFHKLLNEENPSEIPELCGVEGPLLDVSEEEVEKALKATKANISLTFGQPLRARSVLSDEPLRSHH